MPSRTEQTTAEWRALAKADPFYVVATREGKAGAWAADEFYSEGEQDWSDFHKHWTSYEPALGGSCLEIGCGAGRITHALARDFHRVTAIDVSADMLALAKQRSPENVEFVQVDGTDIPLPDASQDAVFTCHVLQHLEGFDVVSNYMSEVRRVLRPGGAAMIQLGLLDVPLPWHARLREELRLRRARRANARGQTDLTFRVRLYGRGQILGLFDRLEFRDIELRAFEAPGSHEVNAFWLARA